MKRKFSYRGKKQVPWTPFVGMPLTPEEINQYPASTAPEKVYENSRYQVFQRTTEAEGAQTVIQLAIRNKDGSARHDWREFQRIKNELLGREAEAVELYPAESRLTDTRNEFHLFCFPGRQERLA